MNDCIVRCGANVNMRGPEGETALHLAAAGGHHEVVKFLLNEGADADIQDDVSSCLYLYDFNCFLVCYLVHRRITLPLLH